VTMHSERSDRLTDCEAASPLYDVAELIRGYRKRGALAARDEPGDPARVSRGIMFLIGRGEG
jgi:hypothetical protein